MEQNKPTTFLLADDHSLIRQGLVFMIEEIGLGAEIIQAGNLAQLLEAVENNDIDIAIIDAHFPDGNSLSVIADIKLLRPEMRILIFTGIDEEINTLKFINAGANGFLSKMSEEEEIKMAIMRMCTHGQYLSSVTQNLLLNSMQNPKLANPLESLSERELEIAEMYAQGLGNLEIANRLNLKQNTVSTIKKRVFDKLKVENIVELSELMKNHLL